MKTALFAAAIFAAAPVFSAPCNVQGLPKISGLSYHLARGKLIEAGFFPVLTATNPDLAPWVDEPRKIYGYAEVSDCSGTGYGGCWYKLKNNKMQIIVYSRAVTGESKIESCRPY